MALATCSTMRTAATIRMLAIHANPHSRFSKPPTVCDIETIDSELRLVGGTSRRRAGEQGPTNAPS